MIPKNVDDEKGKAGICLARDINKIYVSGIALLFTSLLSQKKPPFFSNDKYDFF